MGWFHGPAEWSEVERILSGRSAPKRPEPTESGKRVKRTGTFLPPVRHTPDEAPPNSTYAELHAHSAYSFLDGASSPEAMVAAAVDLGLSHIALTDHNGFYGVVRFAEAAAEHGIATVFGSELTLPGDEHLLVLARGNEGYRRLSASIAEAHMRGGEKGVLSYDIDALA
ncbi:PHP domain-containing protein, partial [Dietzia timorensis]